jgi:hypothetical protein
MAYTEIQLCTPSTVDGFTETCPVCTEVDPVLAGPSRDFR